MSKQAISSHTLKSKITLSNIYTYWEYWKVTKTFTRKAKISQVSKSHTLSTLLYIRYAGYVVDEIFLISLIKISQILMIILILINGICQNLNLYFVKYADEKVLYLGVISTTFYFMLLTGFIKIFNNMI